MSYKFCKHNIGSCCDLGGLCIPRPNTNCPKEWFENEGIFDGAKFGDRFVARNGDVAIFLGRSRIGNKYCLAFKDGDHYVVHSPNPNGVLTFGWEDNFDIVSRWGEEKGQPLIK